MLYLSLCCLVLRSHVRLAVYSFARVMNASLPMVSLPQQGITTFVEVDRSIATNGIFEGLVSITTLGIEYLYPL